MIHDMRIAEKVNAIVCNTLTIESIGYESDLIELGLLDSLSLVQMMVEIEEVFNVSIDAEDFDFGDYRSVKAITEMIERNSYEAFFPS